MDNPTVPNHVDRDATTEVAAQRRQTTVSPARVLALSRIWVVVNLAAIAAVGAALADRTSPALLIGWSTFTALNALLHLASRTGTLVGNAASSSTSFNVGIAAVLGLAWGSSMILLLPHASGIQLAVLAAANFAVAVIAIPVFSEQKGAFYYFLTTLTVLALAAILRDGRFYLAAAWLLLGSACLVLVGSVYYRTHAHLRGIVRTLLDPANSAPLSTAPQPYLDDDLAALAAKKIDALNELYAANERNRRVLRALGDAVVATTADGLIDYANPVAEVLLGWTHKELKGRPIETGMRVVFPPDQRNQAREIFDQTRLTRRAQHCDDNTQLMRRDGVVYGVDYVVTPIKDEHGEFVGATYVLRDVTEKRHRAENVAWQATHDPLTGSINRAEFEIRLKKLVRRSQDDSGNVHALLYLDIDKFKFINDSYGHAAGDAALKTLADVLRTRIRGADTLARVGGDEFSALLYSCSAEKARLIAEGLRIAVERHAFKWQTIALPMSLSIGIVEINRECKSVAEIVRAADSACFTAKKFGRNRVHLFERTGNTLGKQARIFDFVKDIQTAIQGNRLDLFYQPLYATGSGDNQKQCELSVGIRNQQGQMIPRAELADLARRYHLTEEIDRWVVKAALDALRLNHPALSEMSLVLVPLSQQSMTDDRLLSYITQQVKDNLAQSPRVGFSFEGSGAAGHLEYVRYFVTALKQYGCQFMIGDLGFGSEAIELVKSAQADFLGIRGTLVQNMLYNSVDYEVVLGLTRIARTLGMKTIAEQADTQSLCDALAKMGVDYTKGQLTEQPRRVSIYSEAQWV